jgi:hypothetical protein
MSYTAGTLGEMGLKFVGVLKINYLKTIQIKTTCQNNENTGV